MPRQPVTVVFATAALAALSGCGGSSKSTQTTSTPASPAQTTTSPASAFASSYQAATVRLESASKAIGAAMREAEHHTNGELAQQFHALSAQWQAPLSALETLSPPAGLAVRFNTLKDSASRVEADLNAIATAAATNDDAAAEQASASLVTDVAAARSADAPIRHQLGLSE
jgi:hypothetical protein